MLDTWLKVPDIHLQRQKNTLKNMQNHTFYKNFYQMKTVSITVLMIVFFILENTSKKYQLKIKEALYIKWSDHVLKKTKKFEVRLCT